MKPSKVLSLIIYCKASTYSVNVYMYKLIDVNTIKLLFPFLQETELKKVICIQNDKKQTALHIAVEKGHQM